MNARTCNQLHLLRYPHLDPPLDGVEAHLSRSLLKTFIAEPVVWHKMGSTTFGSSRIVKQHMGEERLISLVQMRCKPNGESGSRDAWSRKHTGTSQLSAEGISSRPSSVLGRSQYIQAKLLGLLPNSERVGQSDNSRAVMIGTLHVIRAPHNFILMIRRGMVCEL